MSFTFTLSITQAAGSEGPTLTAFSDGLASDPPTVEFDSSMDGTLRWDFHSSSTAPAAGSGDIATGTQSVVGGPQAFTLNLAAYPEETGYLHFRVINAGNESNVLTSQVITTPATFDPVALFGVSDKGLVIDPALANKLYSDTGKTDPAATDGDSIAVIVDASGKTADLVQSTSGYRPVYKTSGGLHWIRTGTDDWFSVPNTFLDHTKDWTIVFAMSREGATGNNVFSYADGSTTRFGYAQAAGLQYQFGVDTTASSVNLTNSANRSTGAAEVVTHTWDRSTGQLIRRINGVQTETTTGTASDITVPSGGYKFNGALGYANTGGTDAKYFFVFFIDRALGTSELNNLEEWAADRAGVTL
jgi:hypothetical protein